MKHQQLYVIVRKISDDPLMWDIRQLRVPIIEKDGQWVAAGPPIDDTDRWPLSQLWGDVAEYESLGEPCPQAVPFTPPEGWEMAAEFRLPPDYVPPSREVIEETHARAVQYLRDIGVIKRKG